MTTYLATIHLVFDVDHDQNEIPDALNCILTENMRKYSDKPTSLIDWAFADEGSALSSIRPVTLPDGYEPDTPATEFPHPPLPDHEAMIDLLVRNLAAWDDEEDSVKDKHEELITELRNFLDEV